MKLRLMILFVLMFSRVFAQDFEYVDATVLKYPKTFSKTTNLSDKINADFKTDSNKVRAIYTWIINNISYDYSDTASYKNIEYSNLKEYYRIVAKMTFLKGHGVCDGYSRLFKQLCNEVGLKCYIVHGTTRTVLNEFGKKLKTNHAWNVAVLNSKKYLVDVTWGAGSYNDKFKRDTSYHYFMTNPRVFLRDHYPENPLYLLTRDIGLVNFAEQPLYYRNAEQGFVQLMYPTKGYLKAGTNASFKLYSKLPNAFFSYSIEGDYFHEFTVVKDGRFQLFNIELPKNTVRQELIIYMNGKAFLGFKVLP